MRDGAGLASCRADGGVRRRRRPLARDARASDGRRRGVDNVRFELADAERLPFADGKFTALMCSNAFHHYPDPSLAAAQMARVVSPGGRVVIGDACADRRAARVADAFLRRFEPGHVRLYRSLELGELLRRAGLMDLMVRRLAGGGFAIVRGVVPSTA